MRMVPETEFSKGTTPNAASPDATASKTALGENDGTTGGGGEGNRAKGLKRRERGDGEKRMCQDGVTRKGRERIEQRWFLFRG